MGFLKCLGFGLLLVQLYGCEKKIDFDLHETASKLVVEATIENGEAPVVILTNSFDYFSNLSAQRLAASFVHNAVIKISDGNVTHTLKEYAIPIALDYKLYYYSTDSAALQSAITGALNQTYNLQIEKDGQQYSAQTTIPDTAKVVDSVWWKPAPPSDDSSRVVVMVKATDPKGFGNYVRYYTKINDNPFFPGLNSVYDDLFVDGTTYELQVEPGFDRNVKREEDDLFFHKGDVVTLKLSSIDRNTYEFWRTMEFSYASIGNPFATPIKVIGNISNGALGYFGGYASQFRTLIIPE